MGYLADGPAVESILNRTFVLLPELDAHIVEFIEEPKQPAAVQNLGSIDLSISLSDHIQG